MGASEALHIFRKIIRSFVSTSRNRCTIYSIQHAANAENGKLDDPLASVRKVPGVARSGKAAAFFPSSIAKSAYLILGVLSAVLSGCASQELYLPADTLMLGEVSHVLTQGRIKKNQLGPSTTVNFNLKDALVKRGFTEEQIDRGRVVVVEEGFYWHNVASGIKHLMLSAVLVPSGMCVERGNIVEYRIGSSGAPTPDTISRIRAPNKKIGKCQYVALPTGIVKGLLGTISMIGPGGAATLYCQGIEEEGWQRPESYWHKPPAGDPPDGQASHISTNVQDGTCGGMPASMPSLAEKGLALLIIRRPYSHNWGARDLSVWIDNKKVAELDRASYTEVTVRARQYALAAAGEGIGSLPKRNVQIALAPGDRIVVEYVINDLTYQAAGDFALMFTPDEVAKKAITFRSRPEYPDGEIPLRYVVPDIEVIE